MDLGSMEVGWKTYGSRASLGIVHTSCSILCSEISRTCAGILWEKNTSLGSFVSYFEAVMLRPESPVRKKGRSWMLIRRPFNQSSAIAQTTRAFFQWHQGELWSAVMVASCGVVWKLQTPLVPQYAGTHSQGRASRVRVALRQTKLRVLHQHFA